VENLNLVTPPQRNLPIHKCFLRNLVLIGVKGYSRAFQVLAPLSFAPMSSTTTSTLITLHLESNNYLPFFLENYEPN
jgi:hypothetical protein